MLSRHWDIFDGYNTLKEVDGEGVVGQKPLIKPGEVFRYKSFCPLKTNFGSMTGFYTFSDEEGKLFKIQIPEFPLVLDRDVN